MEDPSRLLAALFEPAFGVDGGHAARPGRGDGLAVVVVLHVASGEHAVHAGAGGAVEGADVAVVIQLELALEQGAVGLVPDGHEEAGHAELGFLARDGVTQVDAPYLGVALNAADHGIPAEVDLGVFEGALLHDLGGPQLVAPVDDRDLGGEAGQKEGLFEGGIAATGHGDVVLAEEEAVAGGAGGHSVAEEALLVGAPQHEGAGAGGDDERVGQDTGLVRLGVADPELEWPRGQVDPADLGRAQLGLEAQRLGPHHPHELGAHDPVDEAGEVLHVGRQHQLAAGLVAGGGGLTLDHEGLELGPRRVQGGGETRRPAPDHDDLAALRI
jgi:hypothetical protein